MIELTEAQVVSLKKMSTAGAADAAIALSQMMSRNIGMNVPTIRVLPFSEVASVIGGAEKIVTGIFTQVDGSAPCNTLFVFPEESAKMLAGILLERKYEPNETLDDIGLSALAEVGNVVGGAYLNSLADATDFDFIPSVPALAIDMAGAIIDAVLATIAFAGDDVIFMETVFTQMEENISGHFFLLPEEGSLERILEAIGVK